MSAPTPPTLSDVLSKVMEAIQTILYQVASAVADNASVIATVLVVGGLVFLFMRYGGRIFRSILGWFRGLA